LCDWGGGVNKIVVEYQTFNKFVSENTMKTLPVLSSKTLWDIDVSTLNFDDASEWIIERVFDRGSLDEVLSVVKYYGTEEVKHYLKNTPKRLPNHSILLAKAIFDLSFIDFKCLEKKPFQPVY
jgi:hypothetical protein